MQYQQVDRWGRTISPDLADYYQRERAKFLKDIHGCVQHGSFTLHSGGHSEWMCDLLPIRSQFGLYKGLLRPSHRSVGIELGGFLLSGVGHGLIRKDGSYYPEPDGPRVVTLMDDVVTTEGSLLMGTEALKDYGVEVAEYLCILDRRINATLPLRSLVTANELLEEQHANT